ncbi:Type 1 glutamine amidotransferase-like domain-containing protein [Streptomyces sp. NPDC048430]|uniref:Type 1 glutamine amidotransferase-like domain-containing protein n=1 Tax=Streptomyces sp. NPDC048430 TaxID=3155388 RepID=UPI00343A2477
MKEQLHRPKFVYGGYSAGACVAGPDLRGIDLIDDPAVLPDGYSSTVEPTCLGLVPLRIVPHWRSEHRDAPGAKRAAAYLAEAGLHHRCLHDGQAVSVHDATAFITSPPGAASTGHRADPKPPARSSRSGYAGQPLVSHSAASFWPGTSCRLSNTIPYVYWQRSH